MQSYTVFRLILGIIFRYFGINPFLGLYLWHERETIHQPFEISFSELDESLLKEHEHTFFELVYILSGTGIQWINNNMFPYHDGHLFMITPGDTHSFEIHTTTKFVDIKF